MPSTPASRLRSSPSSPRGRSTGPTGGGFFLIHEPGAPPVVLDCFFAVPARTLGAMDEVVIDFADAGTQTFHVGEGSVAVPGLVQGLVEAHRRHGSQPWSDLLEPAIALAARGFARDEARSFLHGILTPILLRTDAGRRVYGEQERVVTAELGATLERIRDVGSAAVAELLPELAADLDAYDVAERAPVDRGVIGCRVVATPWPSRGGQIVVDILELLAAADEPRPVRGSTGRRARLRRVCEGAAHRYHPHLRDRRGRDGGRVVDDARVGFGRLPRRLPAEQHARRARRDRARAARGWRAAAEHDDADTRARERDALVSYSGARAPSGSRGRSPRSPGA